VRQQFFEAVTGVDQAPPRIQVDIPATS